MTRYLQTAAFVVVLLGSTPVSCLAAEPGAAASKEASKSLYKLVSEVRTYFHSLKDKSNETRFDEDQNAWEQHRSSQALFIAGMASADESLYKRSYFQTYNRLTQERITFLKQVLELSIGY